MNFINISQASGSDTEEGEAGSSGAEMARFEAEIGADIVQACAKQKAPTLVHQEPSYKPEPTHAPTPIMR